jgi:hypothetical protein
MSLHNEATLEALSGFLEAFQGDLPPSARVRFRITHKKRSGGLMRHARGLISMSWMSPWGEIIVQSGVTAARQPRAEQGWYVLLVPDARGEGVVLPCPVIDDSGRPLSSHSEELRSLAWDFWSYQDIEIPVLCELENRYGDLGFRPLATRC